MPRDRRRGGGGNCGAAALSEAMLSWRELPEVPVEQTDTVVGGGGAPLAALVVISLYNCSGKIRPRPADPHNRPH